MKRRGIDSTEVRPWVWATCVGRDEPVEVVSYPTQNDAGQDTIMVRMKVGDPTSMREVPLRAIACIEPDQHPDYYRPRVYYSDNPTVFFFGDDPELLGCGNLIDMGA